MRVGVLQCQWWLDRSAGSLLWIYRRLIGWPYISTRSAGPNISQYIGSTRQACNTSLQCIVEFITNEYHTAETIGLHFGCNVCFISTIRYSKAPYSEIYNTYQILLKLHGATTETYRQYIGNIWAIYRHYVWKYIFYKYIGNIIVTSCTRSALPRQVN